MVSNPTTNNAPQSAESMEDEESDTEVHYEKGDEEEEEDELVERRLDTSDKSRGFKTEVNLKPKTTNGPYNHEEDIPFEQRSSFERVNNETHDQTQEVSREISREVPQGEEPLSFHVPDQRDSMSLQKFQTIMQQAMELSSEGSYMKRVGDGSDSDGTNLYKGSFKMGDASSTGSFFIMRRSS